MSDKRALMRRRFRPVTWSLHASVQYRRPNPPPIGSLGSNSPRIGLERGYPVHSMRATFITAVLDNGAGLEDVQRAADHGHPSTTRLYDRCGHNPEKSVALFATY